MQKIAGSLAALLLPAASSTPGGLRSTVYLDMLAWGVGLNGQQWLILYDVTMSYSMLTASDRLHLPVDEVRRRYDQAIDAVHRRVCAG
jgi:hypothetical protein